MIKISTKENPFWEVRVIQSDDVSVRDNQTADLFKIPSRFFEHRFIAHKMRAFHSIFGWEKSNQVIGRNEKERSWN